MKGWLVGRFISKQLENIAFASPSLGGSGVDWLKKEGIKLKKPLDKRGGKDRREEWG